AALLSLDLAARFFFPPQLLVAPPQQISSLRVIRLLARGLLQRADGLGRFPLFEKDAPRQRQRLDRLRLLRQRRFDAAAGGVELILLLQQRSEVIESQEIVRRPIQLTFEPLARLLQSSEFEIGQPEQEVDSRQIRRELCRRFQFCRRLPKREFYKAPLPLQQTRQRHAVSTSGETFRHIGDVPPPQSQVGQAETVKRRRFGLRRR